MKKTLFMILGCVLAGTFWAWSQPHKVHGKTAEEWFPDSQVAELAKAACRGDATKVKELVGSGTDVNALSPNRQSTPLRWALVCENVAGTRALLEAGADPNLEMDRGHTAVTITAAAVNSELLRTVLAHGGDPNAAPDSTYHRALNDALGVIFHGGDRTNFDLLIEHGADINAANINNATIAERAQNLNQYCVVHELLDIGYSYRIVRLYHMAIRSQEINTLVPGDRRDCRDALIVRLEPLLAPGEYDAYLAELQARVDAYKVKKP